ncbi:hypothetical protein K0M31_011487 [Melipona bicolor]|uniref:Uncharacterized protein n=1 Tax=Melipona bicolor TaxID=60889 RepID=A0AA40G9M9_9HYME|nr:hypothetical protein K0M31_011487 [Melipona bicolor]
MRIEKVNAKAGEGKRVDKEGKTRRHKRPGETRRLPTVEFLLDTSFPRVRQLTTARRSVFGRSLKFAGLVCRGLRESRRDDEEEARRGEEEGRGESKVPQEN